jgi:hypothetical protein
MGKLSRERENEIKRILPLVLLAVLVGADVAAACTSFAVFFDEPIFGMNSDCYPTEIRFGVVADDALDVKLFGMLVDYNGTSGISVLMTSSGLFGAMQQQRPASEGEKRILSWRDFGATLGRSVPPHRGEGEIWPRCLNGEAILDIYVSEE